MTALGWVAVSVAGLALVGLALVLLVGPLTRRLLGDTSTLSVKDRIEVTNSTRQMLVQISTGALLGMGAIGTVGTLIYTGQSSSSARRQEVTGRFTTAVGQLNSEMSSVRVGGIHALEEIASDSPDHHDAVTAVICAYLQERSRGEATPRPHLTIEAALVALGKLNANRDVDSITIRTGPIAADGTHLRGVDFRNMDLSGVDFTDADLRGANLTGATLTNAIFRNANLTEADVRGTDLSSAIGLSRAQLTAARKDGQTRLPSQVR